jgi:hypothetical protein
MYVEKNIYLNYFKTNSDCALRVFALTALLSNEVEVEIYTRGDTRNNSLKTS